jgi:hypothetical protein
VEEAMGPAKFKKLITGVKLWESDD